MTAPRPVSPAVLPVVPATPVVSAPASPAVVAPIPADSYSSGPANDNLPAAQGIPVGGGAARLFAEAPVMVPPAGVDIEAALAAVKVEQIRKDVSYLADDARGGRATPSKGLTESAEYFRDRLQAHGWRPGAPNESYFYNYPLYGAWFDAARTRLFMGGKPFAYGKDYFYGALANRGDVSLEGDVVFAGNGSATVYEGIEARGRWVVVTDDRGVSLDERREAARRAGAAGLVVLPHPDFTGDDEKLDCLAHQARKGPLSYAPDDGVDEIVFTRAGARRFLRRLGRNAGADGQGILAQGPGLLASMALKETRVLRRPIEPLRADNVVGFWKGSDPELSKVVILLTAHYDHLGSRGSTIYNGADDNASGSALHLQLVEALPKLNLPFSVMIMWVSGEEKGLLGSAAWVKNPYFPDGVTPFGNINTDMVGRNAPGTIYVTPSKAHRRYNRLTRTAEAEAPKEGFNEPGSADDVYSRSDHAEFAKLLDKNGKPIPILFFTSGMHTDYHRPSDDADKIVYEKLARTTRLVLRVLAELQADELSL